MDSGVAPSRRWSTTLEAEHVLLYSNSRSRRGHALRRIRPYQLQSLHSSPSYSPSVNALNSAQCSLPALRLVSSTQVDYPCDYVVLAPGGDLSPITDDREADGTIVGRRARLKRQVEAALSSGESDSCEE